MNAAQCAESCGKDPANAFPLRTDERPRRACAPNVPMYLRGAATDIIWKRAVEQDAARLPPLLAPNGPRSLALSRLPDAPQVMP